MADDKVNKQIEELRKISRDDGKKEYAKAQFELGLIYEDKKHDYDKAEKCYLNITKEDYPYAYFAAQWNLANLYQNHLEKPDYDKAAACYLNITKKESFERYAQAQINLGHIYCNIKHDYDKAEKCYLNITKDEFPDWYFTAQWNLGDLYRNQFEKPDYDKAAACYLNITKKESFELYVLAQINLGHIYCDIKHDYDKAEKCYLNITKNEYPDWYFSAQLKLGDIYQKKFKNSDYDKAESCYLNITKKESFELYPQAQISLGHIYSQLKNNFDMAEKCYLNITKREFPDWYFSAQWNLALLYQNHFKNPDYDKAEACYLNITKKESFELYPQAQINLGHIYSEIKHDYDKSEKCYLNITKTEFPDWYFSAQWNLALLYHNKIEKPDYDKAEKCYLNINKKDFSKLYFRAQINLGYIYSAIKKDYDKAEQLYSSIIREEAPDDYAIAQYMLGTIYIKNKQDYDKALKFYSNIIKNDEPTIYAKAQLEIGYIYNNIKHNYDKAKEFYSNISIEDDPEIYSKAQFELGNIYLFKKNDINEFYKYYNQIKYFSSEPNHFISAQLILELDNLKSKLFDNIKEVEKLTIDYIKEICHLAKKIKDSLMVSFDKKSLLNETTVTKNPERRVAHYTRPGVLFNLLKGKNPSKFRLNIVDFMNDPSENQVLTQWLNITTNPDNEIKTFLASFSFNHNSLNQFRLYGNEDNIFGSGVSIAFNHNFFGQNAERSINMENFNITKQFSTSTSENENQILSLNKTEDKPNTNLYPLPIYRCLYFDPKTEYISLAKRNKQSFYLEMSNEKETQDIENEWKNYIDTLNEQKKIQDIRIHLKKINVLMSKLLKNRELQIIPNLQQLLSLAVLPISCLIKHAAFEDEDECRMIYITHIADKNIVEPTDYQAANNLYIEYKEVEDYIDKIYLGPQCKMQHKLWLDNHFKKKHNGKEIKLIKSEMPLR